MRIGITKNKVGARMASQKHQNDTETKVIKYTELKYKIKMGEKMINLEDINVMRLVSN